MPTELQLDELFWKEISTNLNFIEKHCNEAHEFDFAITYEEVGVYVPEFLSMCS